MTAACAATASTWLVLKFSSLVQMSLTLTGLIPGGKGACFGGEKNSLTRVPKVPKLPPQETARRLLTRSEEHTSELQSQSNIVCRLLLEKKNHTMTKNYSSTSNEP